MASEQPVVDGTLDGTKDSSSPAADSAPSATEPTSLEPPVENATPKVPSDDRIDVVPRSKIPSPAPSKTESESETPVVTLHHLANARSQRILWLMEEHGIPYAVKKYEKTSAGLAPPELLKVHPLGKSPVITDEKTGRVVAESAVIVDYLITKYGKGKTEDVDEEGWIDNLYFSNFAEATLQPRLVNRRIFNSASEKAPRLIRPVAKSILSKLDATYVDPELKRCGGLVEKHLKKARKAADGSVWFAGGETPTSADFMMSFTLEVFVARAPAHCGKLTKEWVKNVQSRPAYKRGLEKGGKFDYLI